MKTLTLSTFAAVAIALSAGTAFAGPNSTDNGFQIMAESLRKTDKAPQTERQFLSAQGTDQGTYDQGVSNNGKDSAEFRAVQTWDRR